MYDAMKELWTNLLEGKAGYGDDVTRKLQEDVAKIAEELQLDANLVTAENAQLMVEAFQGMIETGSKLAKANENFHLLDRLPSIRGKGLAAAAVVAEQAVKQEISPTKQKIKMIAYGAMVVITLAMYIGTAVAAYKAWPVLKDADRAKLILGTIQKALSTIASGGEAWKQYIEYRPFQNGETPANIDTSRFTASGEPTDAERTFIEGEMQGRFSNESGSIDRVLEGADMESTTDRLSQDWEMMNDEELIDVDLNDEAERPIAEAEVAAPKGKAFNITMKFLRVAMIAIGAAIAVATGFSIYQNWDKMSDVDRGLNCASLVLQVLSSVIEVTTFLIEVGVTALSALTTVCAIAGPILAFVGVVLMFVMMFIKAHQPSSPSKPEEWIENTGRKYVDSLKDPPTPKLKWTTDTASFTGGAEHQTLELAGKKESQATVKLGSISADFTAGTSKSALFADADFKIAGSTPTDEDGKPTSPVPTGDLALKTAPEGLRKSLDFGFVPTNTQHGEKISDTETEKQVTWHVTVRRMPKLFKDAGVEAALPDDTPDREKKEKEDPDDLYIGAGDSVKIKIMGRIGPKYEHPYALVVWEQWAVGEEDQVEESFEIERK